jgi:hypothetical protein
MLAIRVLYKNPPLILKKVNINGAMVGIKPDYIQKKSTLKHYEDREYYNTTLDLFKNFKLNYPKIKNLFIAQNYYIEYKRKPKKYNKTLENLFELLMKYDFKFKKHPKFKEPVQLSNLQKLPDFLPVELFFNCVENSIIAFHTTSLITASYFENIKAISVLDLINNSQRDFILNWRKKMKSYSGNQIYFPNSLEELNNLLKN